MELGFITSNLNSAARRETLQGRSFLVADATILREGVLNGSEGALFYPNAEIKRNPQDWNGMPILRYHPDKNGGIPSGRTPQVFDKQGMGWVFDAKITDDEAGKLGVQLWFDEERVRKMDPDIHGKLQRGEKIELSTGLFTDNEPAQNGANHNGSSYVYIAKNYRPDHLAILPDQVGACSLKDGCGVFNEENVENALPSTLKPKKPKAPPRAPGTPAPVPASIEAVKPTSAAAAAIPMQTAEALSPKGPMAAPKKPKKLKVNCDSTGKPGPCKTSKAETKQAKTAKASSALAIKSGMHPQGPSSIIAVKPGSASASALAMKTVEALSPKGPPSAPKKKKAMKRNHVFIGNLCVNCGGKGGKPGPCAVGGGSSGGSDFRIKMGKVVKALGSAPGETAYAHFFRDEKSANRFSNKVFPHTGAKYHGGKIGLVQIGQSKKSGKWMVTVHAAAKEGFKENAENCGGEGGKPGPCSHKGRLEKMRASGKGFVIRTPTGYRESDKHGSTHYDKEGRITGFEPKKYAHERFKDPNLSLMKTMSDAKKGKIAMARITTKNLLIKNCNDDMECEGCKSKRMKKEKKTPSMNHVMIGNICVNCGGKGGKPGPCATGGGGSSESHFASRNPTYGYHGEMRTQHGGEAAGKHFKAAAKTISDHFGVDANTARNYLDSSHGRHVGSNVKATGNIISAMKQFHVKSKNIHKALKAIQGAHEMFEPKSLSTNCGGEGGTPGPCKGGGGGATPGATPAPTGRAGMLAGMRKEATDKANQASKLATDASKKTGWTNSHGDRAAKLGAKGKHDQAAKAHTTAAKHASKFPDGQAEASAHRAAATAHIWAHRVSVANVANCGGKGGKPGPCATGGGGSTGSSKPKAYGGWSQAKAAAGGNEGQAYIIDGTMKGIAAGRSPDKAFIDAAENENHYGDKPQIRAGREAVAKALKKHFNVTVNPHHKALSDDHLKTPKTNSTGKSVATGEKEGSMTKKQNIDWLVANVACLQGEKAQVILNEMDETELDAMRLNQERLAIVENALENPVQVGQAQLKLSLNDDNELEAEVMNDGEEADDDDDDDDDLEEEVEVETETVEN